LAKPPLKGDRMGKRLRKALFLALLMSAAAGSVRAANAPEAIPLWPHGAPGEKDDADTEKTLPREQEPGTTLITDVNRPSIAVYRPPDDRNTGTAVVICPGGGYNLLAWDKEGTEVAEWLNTLGVTGVVLKYRVPARKGQERHAAPLQDVQRALGVVRQRAKEWGIDPDRIGVLGFSAGGHLAAVLSSTYDKRTYEAADDADRESCRPAFTLLIYPGFLVGKAEEGNKLAAELKVTKDTPPTFLVMAEDDGVRVENVLFYYEALKTAKVPAELHVYPSGGHGYGLRPSKHEVATWPQRAEQWLRALGMLERKK
jgi:acetyl esterase/lipase